MAFIRLTDCDDHPVYINVRHIVTVEESGKVTRVDFDSDIERNHFLLVKEKIDEVMRRIEEASDRGPG